MFAGSGGDELGAMGASDPHSTLSTLADQVAENDGTFTRHSASRFSRDSGAAAVSSVAWNPEPRSLAFFLSRKCPRSECAAFRANSGYGQSNREPL
jgi:hypothetical protein